MNTEKLLDGKQTAKIIRTQLAETIHQNFAHGISRPGLAVVVVGNHSASQLYVKNKKKACDEVGMITESYQLPERTSQVELIELINSLNHEPHIHGILVQLPLPDHINEYDIIDTILPAKDVDGFHPYTLGRLAQRRPLLRPCTALGVIELLQRYQIPLQSIDATVVGASNIVGRPMMLELLMCGATVTTTHRFTKNLQQYIQLADLLVVATGKMDIIDPQWIKPGATVVDVGIHHLPDNTIRGDLNFTAAEKIAGKITPVPGGVGPMTIAMLLKNTLHAQQLQSARHTAR